MTMDYSLVRYIHVTAVSLSIVGFILRFIGVQMHANWVHGKAARTLPHINDTVLLVSAITLAVLLHINPIDHPWLIAKIIALLVYIGLGMVALKSHVRATVRVISGLLALVVYSYIVSVAVSKNVAGWIMTFSL